MVKNTTVAALVEAWITEAVTGLRARIDAGSSPEKWQDSHDYAAIDEIAALEALILILTGWRPAPPRLNAEITREALGLPPFPEVDKDVDFLELALNRAQERRDQRREDW